MSYTVTTWNETRRMCINARRYYPLPRGPMQPPPQRVFVPQCVTIELPDYRFEEDSSDHILRCLDAINDALHVSETVYQDCRDFTGMLAIHTRVRSDPDSPLKFLTTYCKALHEHPEFRSKVKWLRIECEHARFARHSYTLHIHYAAAHLQPLGPDRRRKPTS